MVQESKLNKVLTDSFNAGLPFFAEIPQNSNVFLSEINKISVVLSEQLFLSVVADVEGVQSCFRSTEEIVQNICRILVHLKVSLN